MQTLRRRIVVKTKDFGIKCPSLRKDKRCGQVLCGLRDVQAVGVVEVRQGVWQRREGEDAVDLDEAKPQREVLRHAD